MDIVNTHCAGLDVHKKTVVAAVSVPNPGGGLRGAISLALALSLPATFADRELLRVMAFGVVLFTLLGQGTTMQFLLTRLGLTQRAEEKLEFERRHGRLMATRAARERIEQWYRDGTISELTWKRLVPDMEREVQRHLDAQHDLLNQHPGLQAEEFEDAKRESLRTQRATLATLLRDGVISERTYEELITEVDSALEQPFDLYEAGSPHEDESNE